MNGNWRVWEPDVKTFTGSALRFLGPGLYWLEMKTVLLKGHYKY